MAPAPQRRSLAQRGQSLRSAINTASSPNLGAAFGSLRVQRPDSYSTPKSSLGYGALSSIVDGPGNYDASYGEVEGSSPSTMRPAPPGASRMISGDVVGNKDLDVGDSVDVPGGMHGIVKFIGEVKGKNGIFAGVELNKEWAARGKNDGDVEGVRYFTTSVPGAGIFLPSSKAYKRLSPTGSSDSFPPTPTTPSLTTFNLGGRGEEAGVLSTTPVISKLSQSVGPGRAASPALKPRSRPSLPRPESPLRKAQNATSTPAKRPSLGALTLSKGVTGTPRYAPSPTPGKFGGSVRGVREPGTGDPGKRMLKSIAPGARTPATQRPASRSQSRLEPHSRFDEDPDGTPSGIARSSISVQGNKYGSRRVSQEDSIPGLRLQLEGRDRQLKEQASSLAEMERNLTELQSLMPNQRNDRPGRLSRTTSVDDADATQLRALLREKNEKIAMLTADFDAHRADFRSTIDTLELASTETERVYEKKVEDLMQEIRELQERGDDVESVAQQLKQLEDLVQELEEGLEDARRGEAEARGEVEFLRGEVERGRSELKREREKAAEASKGQGTATNGGLNSHRSSREVEQRDDEIRGLKAIIHSLSRDAVPDVGSPRPGSQRVPKQRHSGHGQTNGQSDEQLAEERKAREKLEREIKELENLVDMKTYREEELENELKTLRAAQKHASAGSNGRSEQTVSQDNWGSGRLSRENSNDWRDQMSPEVHRRGAPLETMPEADSNSEVTDGSNLWCEICDAHGHDILTCTNMFGNLASNNQQRKFSPSSQRTGRDVVAEGLKSLQVDRRAPAKPISASPAIASTPKAQSTAMPNPMDQDMVPGKASGVIDASKWCALCERDGHESVDCPFDDAY